MAKEDRADDALALEGNEGRVGHESARFPTKDPLDVPPPILVGANVHPVGLLEMPVIDLPEERRKAGNLTLLRRLQSGAD